MDHWRSDNQFYIAPSLQNFEKSLLLNLILPIFLLSSGFESEPGNYIPAISESGPDLQNLLRY